MAAAGTLFASASAAAAQARYDQATPGRVAPGTDPVRQHQPGMARMHELMIEQNPGMARMHRLMTDGPR